MHHDQEAHQEASPEGGHRMTVDQFHEALAAIKCYTYDQAAAAIGTHRRTLIQYGTGELAVPVLVARMHLLQKHGVPEQWRLRDAG